MLCLICGSCGRCDGIDCLPKARHVHAIGSACLLSAEHLGNYVAAPIIVWATLSRLFTNVDLLCACLLFMVPYVASVSSAPAADGVAPAPATELALAVVPALVLSVNLLVRHIVCTLRKRKWDNVLLKQKENAKKHKSATVLKRSSHKAGAGKRRHKDSNETQRPFDEEWRDLFDPDEVWLTCDNEGTIGEQVIRCEACSKAGYTRGLSGGTASIRKERITEHLDQTKKNYTNHASNVLELKKQRSIAQVLKAAVKKELGEMEQFILSAMENVYWLAQEDVAIIKAESLADLKVISLVCQTPRRKDGKHPYSNASRAREFVSAFASVLKTKKWSKILDSPAVSILIDESSDISNSENMVIYICYLDTSSGEVVVTFLELAHAPDTTAAGITKALLTLFHKHGLDTRKVTCFASDGASVMTGWKNGVAAKLKENNPYMLSIHCIAHRLALACNDCTSSTGYEATYEKVLNEISTYFNRSPQRQGKLSKATTEFGINRNTIVRAGKTRWLSRAQCMDVLLVCYQALVQVFQEDDLTLSSALVAQYLVSFAWIGYIVFLADILSMLANLSKKFQSDMIDYSTAMRSVRHVKESIIENYLFSTNSSHAIKTDDVLVPEDEEVKSKDAVLFENTFASQLSYEDPLGTNFVEFTSSVNQNGVYGEQKLRREVGDTDNLFQQIREFAWAALVNLTSRFPVEQESTVFALDVFKPEGMSEDARSLRGYGDKQIDTLAAWYGEAKEEDGVRHEAIVDSKELKKEWQEN